MRRLIETYEFSELASEADSIKNFTEYKFGHDYDEWINGGDFSYDIGSNTDDSKVNESDNSVTIEYMVRLKDMKELNSVYDDIKAAFNDYYDNQLILTKLRNTNFTEFHNDNGGFEEGDPHADWISGILEVTIALEDIKEAEGRSFSFWVTSAFDTHSTVYAYGADYAYDHECYLDSIAKRLGQKYFHQFSVGRGQRFKSYSQLVKYLNSVGMRTMKFSEEDLIDLFYDEKFGVYRS